MPALEGRTPLQAWLADPTPSAHRVTRLDRVWLTEYDDRIALDGHLLQPGHPTRGERLGSLKAGDGMRGTSMDPITASALVALASSAATAVGRDV